MHFDINNLHEIHQYSISRNMSFPERRLLYEFHRKKKEKRKACLPSHVTSSPLLPTVFVMRGFSYVEVVGTIDTFVLSSLLVIGTLEAKSQGLQEVAPLTRNDIALQIY